MSDVYPITVLKESARANSSSGGKDYHLVLVKAANGKSLVIYRWGKKDQWGSGWDVKRFDTADEAEAAFRSKHREKMGREHRNRLPISGLWECDNQLAFKARLGLQYFGQLGASNLHHIDPDMDVTGSREREVAEWDENEGRAISAEERKRRAEAVKALEPKQETVEERAAETNSAWGMF